MSTHASPQLHADRTSRTGVLDRLLRAIARRMKIRADRQHLSSLPNSMLRDIGMRRDEIRYATEFGRTGRARYLLIDGEDALEGMHLRQLADLPMGREPTFLDGTASHA